MGAAAAGLAIAAADAANLRIYLPLGSLGVFLYWQLMPIASASMGSALDLRKLLAYPIPHAKLFTVEVLLRLTTAIEMLIVLAGGVAAAAGGDGERRGGGAVAAAVRRLQPAAGVGDQEPVRAAAGTAADPRGSCAAHDHAVGGAALGDVDGV